MALKELHEKKPERIKQFQELTATGYSRKEICQILGVSRGTLTDYAVELGTQGLGKKVDKDFERKCLELRAQGMYQREIAKQLGVDRCRVKRYLQRAGKHGNNFEFCQGLTTRQYSILLGTLLGDATLHYDEAKTATNAQLGLGHCLAQKDWLAWKRDELKVLFTDTPIYEGVRDDGTGKQHPYVYASSRLHPLLTEMRKCMYFWDEADQKVRKHILQEDLDRVDDLALMCWYVDDGSWHSCEATLAIGNISMDEVLLVKSWLENLGLPTRLNRHTQSDKCWTLAFRKAEQLKLFSRIGPHLPPCMRYKMGPYDSEFPYETISAP